MGLAKEWKAGNGNDPDVKIGPLVSAMQKERVASQVAAALESGARVVCRGSHIASQLGRDLWTSGGHLRLRRHRGRSGAPRERQRVWTGRVCLHARSPTREPRGYGHQGWAGWHQQLEPRRRPRSVSVDRDEVEWLRLPLWCGWLASVFCAQVSHLCDGGGGCPPERVRETRYRAKPQKHAQRNQENTREDDKKTTRKQQSKRALDGSGIQLVGRTMNYILY